MATARGGGSISSRLGTPVIRNTDLGKQLPKRSTRERGALPHVHMQMADILPTDHPAQRTSDAAKVVGQTPEQA